MKKVFSVVLIALLSLVALALLTAFFVPRTYEVERSIAINQPPEKVFNYVKLLKNQDQYSVWASMDPNMTKSFSGADGQVGFISAWDSENPDVGKGEQEITAIEDHRVEYELRFMEPFTSVSPAFMEVVDKGQNQSVVHWGISGRFSYPTNLFLLVMPMEEMIAQDFDTGLANLKKIMETP